MQHFVLVPQLLQLLPCFSSMASRSFSTSSGLIEGPASEWYDSPALSRAACLRASSSSSQRSSLLGQVRHPLAFGSISSCSFAYAASFRPTPCRSRSNSVITRSRIRFSCVNPGPSWIPFRLAASSRFLFSREISMIPTSCSAPTRNCRYDVPASWGTAPAGSEFQPVKVIVAVLAVWPHAEVVPVEFDPAEILRQILPARHIFIVENCVCFQIGSCNFIKVDCPRKITNQVVFLPELRKIKFQSLLFPVKILPFLLIEAGLPTDPFFVASKSNSFLVSCIFKNSSSTWNVIL